MSVTRKVKTIREVTGREHRFGEEADMDALCLKIKQTKSQHPQSTTRRPWIGADVDRGLDLAPMVPARLGITQMRGGGGEWTVLSG